MTIEGLQSICTKLPGVTQDIKWEDHLCFNVGEKMFLITSPDNVPVSASFKASDSDFEELSCKEGMMPAPYLARYKWIFVDDISRLSTAEWKKYIKTSYDLVVAKLPLKLRKSLL